VEPQNFLQHKGSDLCWDLECPKCGLSAHIDGAFNYFLKCGGCGQYYEVATRLEITPVDAPRDGFTAMVLEEDE
jgi:transcription elongation factor Elf1